MTSRESAGNTRDTASSGAAPEASGTVPEASGTVPKASGTVPKASGAAPEASGDTPHASDAASGSDDRWQNQLTTLGGFIRMQRRLADLSLREMASITSVSNAYLSQIERGLHQPSLRVLRSIAQALSISPEELLRRANFISPKDGTDQDAAPDQGAEARPVDTEAAILADPRLSAEQRAALLNVYRNFRDTT